MKHIVFYESADDVGAEEFAAGDPFVLKGVVRRWELREWNEALAGS